MIMSSTAKFIYNEIIDLQLYVFLRWTAASTVEAGFGCPLNQMKCHKHCQSVRYRGGYCTNFLKTTCKCYGWDSAYWNITVNAILIVDRNYLFYSQNFVKFK